MYPVVEFEKVQPGIEGVVERDVDASLLTSHVGGRGTFATPAMIGLMEWCSHGSVKPYLPLSNAIVIGMNPAAESTVATSTAL